MIFDKILHNDNIEFVPNTTYLLAKPNNRYVIIITDSKGNPAYPYSENSELNFGVSQSLQGEHPEKISSSDTLIGYKPHFSFDKLEDGSILLKMSDNIMSAIANSYKKIQTPNPNKSYALGLDGKAVELNFEFLDNLIIENGVLSKVEKILNIPKGVKKINEGVFYSKGIDKVTIPTSVEEIGANAFTDNNIELVTLPAFCKYYQNSFDSSVIITGGKKQD